MDLLKSYFYVFKQMVLVFSVMILAVIVLGIDFALSIIFILPILSKLWGVITLISILILFLPLKIIFFVYLSDRINNKK